MEDYFALLGVPRRLALNEEDLRRRFYALSRRHHPDFHQLGTTAERASALGTSAQVNRAYKTLRDPLARLEYLIALEEGREARPGATDRAPDRAAAPPALLAEMLEVQEALEAAKAAGMTEAARRDLREERDRLLERDEVERRAILGRMGEWDTAGGGDRRDLREWFKQRLAARAYLRTVIGDLGEALGEDGSSDGSYRRH
jgi:molecular chaperone HscB